MDINSAKANSIKVGSIVPGYKYYGDNIYGEYQMVNPRQQFQYENNNIGLRRYQHKQNGTDALIKDIIVHGVNNFGYYRKNLYQYGSNGTYSPVSTVETMQQLN